MSIKLKKIAFGPQSDFFKKILTWIYMLYSKTCNSLFRYKKILSGISQINLWKPFQTIYIEIRMKLGLGSHKVLFDYKLFKQHIICYIIRKNLLLVNEANL